MELTLKSYTQVLPKELIMLAKKNKVRECDETEKWHFIAYVDEGDNTFDVSLVFSTTSEVKSHICDCQNISDFCRHKTALLMHIDKGKKISTKVKPAKNNRVELLLEDVEFGDLKDWVRIMLQKDKGLGLAFVHHFASSSQQYTPDEVTKICNDAVKAVVGNKKNIDVTQLKKLVELWTDMLAPVVDKYLANVAAEQHFLNFHTMANCIMLFYNGVSTQAVRL